MLYIIYSKIRAIITILTAALLITCASTGVERENTQIKNGAKPKYSSLLMYRIKYVIDWKPKRNMFDAESYKPTLQLDTDTKTIYRSDKQEDEWKILNDTYVYERSFVVKAIPGFYRLGKVDMYTNVSSLISMPIHYSINMKEKQFTYLGTIVIHASYGGNNIYNFRYNIESNKNDAEYDIVRFSEKYPRLFEQYRDNMALAVFYNIQNIENSGIKYIGKRGQNDEIMLTKFKERIKIPTNRKFMMVWDINLELGKHIEGKDEPHGIFIGNDMNNMIYFGITHDRKAIIRQKVQGTWTDNELNVKLDAIDIGMFLSHNSCKAVFQNNEITYYINNKLAGEIENKLNLTDPITGIFTCSEGIASLDEYYVTEIPD